MSRGTSVARGETYEQFVEKFKPKKTTDDCFTPEPVYEAVANWACERYGVQREQMVRPFWPGRDYQADDYSPDCVVCDNPPFSIYAQILQWFSERGISFFLFAPTLTLFSCPKASVCYIPCGVTVTYENGAQVNTSFATNLDRARLRTAPTLYRTVKDANDTARKSKSRKHAKYVYPDSVLTAAAAYQFGRYVDFCVMPDDCRFIRQLDDQKAKGLKSGIFGGAFLLSENAAAERKAAEALAQERAANVKFSGGCIISEGYCWSLSERENAVRRDLRRREN